MHEAPEWILVGRVRRPHGNRGQLLVQSLSERDERFVTGARLHLSMKGALDRSPVRIVSVRKAEKGLIVLLEGLDTREKAEKYTGAEFFIPFSKLAPARAGAYYPFQLEGCEVYDGDRLIGSVVALTESKANPYLEIETGGEGAPVLVPFVREVIRSVDLDRGRIDIVEGFLR